MGQLFPSAYGSSCYLVFVALALARRSLNCLGNSQIAREIRRPDPLSLRRKPEGGFDFQFLVSLFVLFCIFALLHSRDLNF
ncbi:hypothetical protein BDW71DRAFT_97986 [Aspergillus fruticulosus]